jgi:hypothetical protein
LLFGWENKPTNEEKQHHRNEQRKIEEATKKTIRRLDGQPHNTAKIDRQNTILFLVFSSSGLVSMPRQHTYNILSLFSSHSQITIT